MWGIYQFIESKRHLQAMEMHKTQLTIKSMQSDKAKWSKYWLLLTMNIDGKQLAV